MLETAMKDLVEQIIKLNGNFAKMFSSYNPESNKSGDDTNHWPSDNVDGMEEIDDIEDIKNEVREFAKFKARGGTAPLEMSLIVKQVSGEETLDNCNEKQLRQILEMFKAIK
jgi:hypothetical protein